MSAFNKTAADRHFKSHAGQGSLGRRGIDAGDFKEHRAGLHDGAPEFRFTLAAAHAYFERLRRDGFVREDPDKQLAFFAERMATTQYGRLQSGGP